MIDPTLAAIRRSILAGPAENSHRVVYADRLDELGGAANAARAEFVRLQVAKEADPDWHGLLCLPERPCGNCRRERELLALAPLAAYRWTPAEFDWALLRDGTFGATFDVRRNEPLELRWSPRCEFRRGFVEHVTCSAADWVAHADALYWSPGQTVPCPKCRGTGRVACRPIFNAGFADRPCGECGPDFRVPRPCPPTAHPITRVTLTAAPGTAEVEQNPETAMVSGWAYRVRGHERWHAEGECEDAAAGDPVWVGLFRLTWPGVEFVPLAGSGSAAPPSTCEQPA